MCLQQLYAYWPPNNSQKRAFKNEIPDKAKWSCHPVKVIASSGNWKFYCPIIVHMPDGPPLLCAHHCRNCLTAAQAAAYCQHCQTLLMPQFETGVACTAPCLCSSAVWLL